MGRLSRRQAPSPGLRRVSSLCLPVTVCEALESSDWTVGWQPVGVAKGGPMATARPPQFSAVPNVVLALRRVCVLSRVAAALPVLCGAGQPCLLGPGGAVSRFLPRGPSRGQDLSTAALAREAPQGPRCDPPGRGCPAGCRSPWRVWWRACG